MSPDTEQLVRHVVLDRGFEVRLERFGGEVACFVTDPADPRGGCGSLRGESGQFVSIERAIVEACTAARDDKYPQATACGRGVKELESGRATSCVLAKVHDGENCRDSEGNARPD
jgi:hypothetical protein